MTTLRLYCQPVNPAAKTVQRGFRSKSVSDVALLPVLGTVGKPIGLVFMVGSYFLTLVDT